MKKISLLLFFLFLSSLSFCQVNPTLAVGLEKLTMNKGTIDVEVLTKIIVTKQKELKQEALRRFMFKMFPEANYTTKYYVQNCLNVLLNEKNPQVIEKEILELTTNYSLSLGVAYTILKSPEKELLDLNKAYSNYKIYSPYYQEMIIKEKSNQYKKKDRRRELTDSIIGLELFVAGKLEKLENDKSINKNDFDILNSKREKLVSYKKKLARLNLRKNISHDDSKFEEDKNSINIQFGIILDIVSLSLSEIPELQKKGFFKNKIDYRSGDFYLNLLNKEFYSKSVADKKDEAMKMESKARDFKESLDSMKLYVCNRITQYVKNYDIINEFIKRNKEKEVENILIDLRQKSLEVIIPIFNNREWIDAYPQIKSTLNEVKQLEDILAFIKNTNIGTTSVQGPLSQFVSCTDNCNRIIISTYIESVRVEKDLKSIKKIISDTQIQNKANSIISLISSNYKTFSCKSVMPKLKLIDVSSDKVKRPVSDSIVKIDINRLIEKINSRVDKINDPKDETSEPKIAGILNDIVSLDVIVNSLSDSKVIAKNIELDSFINGNFLEIETNNFNDGVKKINDSIIDLINNTIKNNSITIAQLKTTLNTNYKIIATSDKFYNDYLTSVLKEMEGEIPFITDSLDSLTISKASEILPKIHTKLKSLINNNDIHMSDIVYLEDYITDKMIELKIRDKHNDKLYNSIIAHNRIIIPLLKIRALQKIGNFGYDEELMNLFEFIANLDNLDKAETYQSIVNMLRDGSKKVEDNLSDGEFKDSYILFINAMKKYTLINPSEEYVEIDVVSFLNELQQYHNRNNKSVFSLYLSMGLNQNFFFDDFKFPDSEESIDNISFASEKIGVKWRITNFKRFEGYENVIKDDVYLNKKAPFINEFYTIVYGSGLLYSLANTSTNENFDFAHVGVGVGMRFYNALDVNLIIGFPFVKDANFGDNAFLGIGLDIPLGEYLENLGNKN
ncbi:hypothetical protein [Flavobacterium sp. GT3P67]|uniref:hypothetical protein n=1 Tax=Flavobacterium sp. GT3P67 TaxID=2541722 RepID=UPI00104887A6|nr:hypothetical protein [Flavobacterium sp. GT3P67]TDE51442.1 hypothetical protein E0H99_12620 [Flavobacterium sp. GT3P67]